jgi:hypothetical protein
MFVYDTIINIYSKMADMKDPLIHSFTCLEKYPDEGHILAYNWIMENVAEENRLNLYVEYLEVEPNTESFQA